ncbi:MAG: response regulator [Patescibacteria group bacterium]
MKILIIDDEISAATTLKALLMSQDQLEIDIAYNGKEGLAKMSAANPPYDVLILDVMMPDFSGLDVCKAMHADEKLKGIPIILNSALPINSKELQGLLSEFQALNPIKGVLEKPFVLEDLLAAIKEAVA